MWSEKKSAILTKIIVIVFSSCLLVSIVVAPQFVDWFIETRLIELEGTKAYFLTSFYSACFPAIILLICLYQLLANIQKDQVFIKENTKYLRISSWCCIAVALICVISMFYYVPYIIIGIAAAFMALIIRVIKNVFSKAIALQEEADYTI